MMEEKDTNPYRAPATDVTAPAPDSSGQPLASRGSRFGAAMIDAIIHIAVTFGLIFMLGFGRFVTDPNAQTMSSTIVLGLVGITIFLLLHGYLLAKGGQTIGKKLVNIRIVDVDTNEILPLGKLVGLRLVPIWVVSLIPFLGALAIMVDILFIFREDRRCIHDQIAGTKVVLA